MTHRDLAAVGARLEEAAQLLPGEPADNAENYDRFESIAIAILDSEYADFPAGVLKEYLHTRLYLKQLELGLIPFPDPKEA
jgi:hypothetical protein